MINELSGWQDIKSFNHAKESVVISNEQLNQKEVLVTLSKIQPGDLIRGRVLLQNQKTFLQLENGLKLLAQLPTPIQEQEFLNFTVLAKEKQRLFLELEHQSQGFKVQAGNLTDEILNELGLKETPEVKEIVAHLMSKQLPLFKHQILQFYHMARHYEMPEEVFSNLAECSQVPQEKELQLLNELKAGYFKTVVHLVEQNLENMSERECNTLAKQLIQGLNKEAIKGILSELKIGEQVAENLQEREVGKATSCNDSSFFERLIESVEPHEIKRINKYLIEKRLIIDIKNLKIDRNQEIIKLTNTVSELKKVVSTLRETTQSQDEHPTIKGLEQVIETIEKYNVDGQYFFFPMQLSEQRQAGELYFFKPNKKRGEKGAGMYIVLALDMPSLKRIEVHLIEQGEKVALKLKVANEEMQTYFLTHQGDLFNLFNETETQISTFEIELLNNISKKHTETTESTWHHLDFKV